MDLDAEMRARLIGTSELAAAAGVSPAAISNIRAGRSRGSMATQRRILEFINQHAVAVLENPGPATLPRPEPARPESSPAFAPLTIIRNPRRVQP
jgi:transcriptional regulator with XRE-family HTH domain